jgi:hypothetical protein
MVTGDNGSDRILLLATPFGIAQPVNRVVIGKDWLRA